LRRLLLFYNVCMTTYNKSWYEANKERILLAQKERRKKQYESMTPEQLQEYKAKEQEKNRRLYAKNRERILGYKKKYASENPEKVKESKRLSRQRKKDYGYLKKYNIDKETYEALLLQQNQVCAICLQPETLMQRNKTILLSVDHCHTTGKVRGLLCAACNVSIGRMNDDISRLQRAIDYLRKFNDTHTEKS
jgi:hypothetical protein